MRRSSNDKEESPSAKLKVQTQKLNVKIWIQLEFNLNSTKNLDTQRLVKCSNSCKRKSKYLRNNMSFTKWYEMKFWTFIYLSRLKKFQTSISLMMTKWKWSIWMRKLLKIDAYHAIVKNLRSKKQCNHFNVTMLHLRVK